MKSTYTCSCCNQQFGNKKEHASHEKKCMRMDVDIDVHVQTKKRPLPKAIRYALWNSTFGERTGSGPCACCGREISQQSFEAGHVIASSRGGSDGLSNLRPICVPCNRSMGNRNMDEFIAEYKN